MTRDDAAAFEQQVLEPWQALCNGLEGLGLNQERRSMRLLPLGLKAEQEQEQQWRLEFELPSGAFATSVLRELCQWRNANFQQE